MGFCPKEIDPACPMIMQSLPKLSSCIEANLYMVALSLYCFGIPCLFTSISAEFWVAWHGGICGEFITHASLLRH
jgi:hypothetical protein